MVDRPELSRIRRVSSAPANPLQHEDRRARQLCAFALCLPLATRDTPSRSHRRRDDALDTYFPPCPRRPASKQTSPAPQTAWAPHLPAPTASPPHLPHVKRAQPTVVGACHTASTVPRAQGITDRQPVPAGMRPTTNPWRSIFAQQDHHRLEPTQPQWCAFPYRMPSPPECASTPNPPLLRLDAPTGIGAPSARLPTDASAHTLARTQWSL